MPDREVLAWKGQESAGPRSFPLDEARAFIRERIPEEPEIHLVLGSGLGGLADGVSDPVSIAFEDVPGFPGAGIIGHAGRFIWGFLGGKRVLVQSGRFHFYEGYPSSLVVAPVRLGAALGAHTVILTNAAGGVRPDLVPGSILLLDDHLNLQGRNPLSGPVEGEEERFPDMSAPYDIELQSLAIDVAEDLEIPISQGTYAAVLGPSYETPAEVRFYRQAGADAVGMSTVPEVIVGRAAGSRVLAFSLITNLAAGIGPGMLEHQEVLDVGREAGGRLALLVREVLGRIPS